MSTTSFAHPVAAAAPLYSRVYALGLLVLVGTCSWTDRQLFAILLQPIKNEFGLSDTQLGLLGGTAFGLFYVSVGLPVACLADRGNRRNIIAIATAVWSVVTALTGMATGFVSLFLCRMGVGIGEAGSAAPSQSLVSDYFSVRHRALAMGVLYSYLPIGYLLSYMLGGLLSDSVGWRKAFVVFGVPGLLLALLVRTTIAEPPQRRSTGAQESSTAALVAAIRCFLGRRSLRHLPLAGTAHGIGMFALATWMPAYMMRTYHLSAGATGIRLSLVMGVGGLIGTLSGGQLVDRLVARTRDVRWYSLACAAFILVSLPFTLSVFAARDANTATLLYVLPMILNHMILGPVVASVQNLAGAGRRAMAAAFYLFLVNLLSTTLGPLIVGALSDFLGPSQGNRSLGYALAALLAVTSTWAAVHFLLGSRSLAADLQEANLASHPA